VVTPGTGSQLPSAASVLAVCAHPDDESFGLGAVLERLRTQGAVVSVLCFTRGEASTLGSSGADLWKVRRAELQAAALELDIEDVELLDHPDGGLDEIPLEELAEAVARAAGRVRADLLVVFDEGGITGHPDHCRATEAALAGAPGLPALAWSLPRQVTDALNAEFGGAFAGREAHEVDLVLDVDRTGQRRAIACHQSQSTDNPVLARRLELLGGQECLRWLRRPGPGGAPAASGVSAMPPERHHALRTLGEEWDQRYASAPQVFRAEPDETLVDLVSPLHPGRAVDLGAGEGRNSLWLAAEGWDVTAVDASEVGLERLRVRAAAEHLSVSTAVDDLVS